VFDLADCRGKITLVSFVFTTCTGSCPGTTARLVQLQRALKQAGLWGTQVRFISITLDPARDSPDALRDYALRYGADLTAWSFVTGPAPAMEAIWKAWEMTPRRTPEGGLDHPSRIYILDPRGRIREIESLETLDTPAVIATVRSLIAADQP
jgi:protein SCO1/2